MSIKEIFPYQLPVGTEFYVTEGAWRGKIEGTEEEKWLLIVETNEKVLLVNNQKSIIGYIKTNEPMRLKTEELYDADPNCDHTIEALWSGIKCTRCKGWFCY